LIPLGIVFLLESFAIYTYNFLLGFIGGIILVAVYHVLYMPRYRIVALAAFLAILTTFLLLEYYGCPSLPALFCRDRAELSWMLESLYLTILLLALALITIVIKYSLLGKET
jgi:hypothetical protein